MPGKIPKTFTFDVSLYAPIKVTAENEKDARRLLSEHVSTVSCVAGHWPNGGLIIFDATIDEGDSASELIEIDGVEV